jgi:hypothetical protein
MIKVQTESPQYMLYVTCIHKDNSSASEVVRNQGKMRNDCFTNGLGTIDDDGDSGSKHDGEDDICAKCKVSMNKEGG